MQDGFARDERCSCLVRARSRRSALLALWYGRRADEAVGKRTARVARPYRRRGERNGVISAIGGCSCGTSRDLVLESRRAAAAPASCTGDRDAPRSPVLVAATSVSGSGKRRTRGAGSRRRAGTEPRRAGPRRDRCTRAVCGSPRRLRAPVQRAAALTRTRKSRWTMTFTHGSGCPRRAVGVRERARYYAAIRRERAGDDARNGPVAIFRFLADRRAAPANARVPVRRAARRDIVARGDHSRRSQPVATRATKIGCASATTRCAQAATIGRVRGSRARDSGVRSSDAAGGGRGRERPN